MDKILSIIIPFYNEDQSEIFPMLSSINIQKGLDFNKVEIILSNDGYNKLNISKDFFNIFKNLNIQLITSDINSGPGVCRQNGLNIATGKYVMFCDCDDVIHNVGILGAMIVEMESNNYKILSTPWLEEVIENDNIVFVSHQQEMTWLHGKMFLRSIFVDNNICFHPQLRVHEDSYILSIITEYVDQVYYTDTISYIWNYNHNSITRKNNSEYSFNSLGIFAFSVFEAVKFLKNKGITNHLEYKVIQSLIYLYFISQSTAWRTDEMADKLYDMESSISKNMNGLWEYIDNADISTIEVIYNDEYVKSFRNFTDITFNEWIHNIRNNY